MTLLVDAGNSRLKLAVSDARGDIQMVARISHRRSDPAGYLTDWLDVNGYHGAMLVCNVLGDDFAIALTTWCRKHDRPVPEFVRVGQGEKRLTVGYREPVRLGVDRYVAMLGATQSVRSPFVVADCGTAVTVDAVDERRVHRGGVILPGIRLMRESLRTGAGVQSPGRPRLFADNTGDAIEGGIHIGLAAAIDRIGKEMADTMEGVATLVLTGGDGEALREYLAHDWTYDPLLLMRGLALLAEKR